jgi:hypothetical protein
VRTGDVFYDDVAEVNADVVSQVHVFMVTGIAGPFIQVGVEGFETRGIIGKNDVMRERPSFKSI